jgi:nucleoid-associated protein YgaU
MASLEKAMITCTVNGELKKIPVMFNPEEYTVNKDVTYAETAIPGLSAPILQFTSGNMQTLEMELFCDTYEEHREGNRLLNKKGEDVRKLTRKLTDLMNIDPKTHAPPILLFTWASLAFTCVLARASQNFVMFLPNGTPVRARLQVAFNEFRNVDLEAKEIKRETTDYSQVHLVRQGDSLMSIAWQSYGDPALWRPIAIANGISDPRSVAMATRLMIPPLPYQDPESGEVFQ